MILQNITLYSWTSRVLMNAIFALVCIVLVGVLINFMISGKIVRDIKKPLKKKRKAQNINFKPIIYLKRG